jgi:hypothetical protein
MIHREFSHVFAKARRASEIHSPCETPDWGS